MGGYNQISSIISLLVAAGLAFIPASIAKRKGYSFGLWWLYGWLLFIVAIIHVSCISNKNAQQTPVYAENTPYDPSANAVRAYANQPTINKSGEGTVFAILAGVCYSIITARRMYNLYVVLSLGTKFSLSLVISILQLITMIGIAVTLFNRKEEKVLDTVAASVLLSVFGLIRAFSYTSCIGFLADAALVALLIIANKKSSIVKNIWFIPATVKLIRVLYYYLAFDGSYFSAASILIGLLFNMIAIASSVFIGLWLWKKTAYATQTPANKYATFYW